ncbi:16S rRNA (guanine(527)-N(7))-methyltransferase RsmG [Helicobacter cholecystus]|uniref:16S rRNA (guanine(527)-N(7))-methyltransferase RsmG n=1 Tax=Helicobacter cholecystus TaxID=45498 RepID=UPI002739A1BF|nr:16S rRNA (guanine(527)-N(7))-methyltransferase RsmG [Helicobacter cholecystus]
MNPKLLQYASSLLKWNQTHNLSGAKTIQEINSHIQNCLFPLKFIAPFSHAIDIGSGAGFPAIPLAILLPQSQFSLTEPRKKRASFLKILCIELELHNVKVYPSLIQDAPIKDRADLITSKAVASTSTLLELAKPFIAPNGAYLFYKGSNLLNEGEEIKEEEIYRSAGEQIYFYRRCIC